MPPRAGERRQEEEQEERGEKDEPRHGIRRVGVAQEGRRQEQHRAGPGQAIERRPGSEARDGQHQKVEHEEVAQQDALVGLRLRKQHRCQESAQERQHRRHLALGDDGDACAQHGDDEHQAEGGAGREEAVVGVARVEREVAEAEPQSREPFREIRHVAAAVKREPRGQERIPDERPRPRRARGPIRLFSMDHFTKKEAAKRMAITPTQVVQRAPMRCSRSSLGAGRGGGGAAAWTAAPCTRGGRRAPRGRRQGLVSRRNGLCRNGRRRRGSGRSFRLGLDAVALLLERPDAVEQVAHPLLEPCDALRRRRLARAGPAVAQRLERHEQRGHRKNENQKRHPARSLH